MKCAADSLAKAGVGQYHELVTRSMRVGEKPAQHLTAPSETRRAIASPLIDLAFDNYARKLGVPQLIANLRAVCEPFDVVRLRILFGSAIPEPNGAAFRVPGRALARGR